MKTYDAMVIGAGPAGATAALMLARAGWSVAIVEKAPFPRRKVCGEFISATSLPLLRALGLAETFLAQAGPPVRQVGLYAGNTLLAADMPRPRDGADAYGRALGREHFDTLVLHAAAAAGAALWQPWALTRVERAAGHWTGTAVAKDKGKSAQLQARIVIAAHGSWEGGTLPTHAAGSPPRGNDLFAFKAHFRHCGLPAGLMPLLVFPGGYGGMVHSDGGRVSLSCCIRRDYLARCRRERQGTRAAEVVIAHIRAACRGVDAALNGATRDATWLSAGPLRPGIRGFCRAGIFLAGNAAGEAHPIIAEGISMAMQSSWLLCERLIARQDEILSGQGTAMLADEYAASWRRNFARRVQAAALFAQVATQPAAAGIAAALLERIPALLTFGAYLSGKARLPSQLRGSDLI
jgi:flavin-dependent dehydrogenase